MLPQKRQNKEKSCPVKQGLPDVENKSLKIEIHFSTSRIYVYLSLSLDRHFTNAFIGLNKPSLPVNVFILGCDTDDDDEDDEKVLTFIPSDLSDKTERGREKPEESVCPPGADWL